MSTFNEETINPFDNPAHTFLVLTNQQQEYSLWPTFVPTPKGWEPQFGPASRDECSAYVETHWTAGPLFPNVEPARAHNPEPREGI
ncbi:MbtH family protein [Teredinibacter turnerae]|uniref:MbtH family protein n=1 Tax=Teredinibacter turnerae TaxID=2426 RepID=UPI0003FC3AD2|nr:MbtH family protein [Teredinibacter turnerae]